MGEPRERQRGQRQDLGKEEGGGGVRAREGGCKSTWRNVKGSKARETGETGPSRAILRTDGNCHIAKMESF